MGKPFRHNEQSLRVVDILEQDGRGLNLTHEVRLGILGHTGAYVPETLEGQVVRRSDQIAYVNHDIDDAVRAGILDRNDIPRSISSVLGDRHSQRINTLVCDIITASRDSDSIVLSPAVDQALLELRSFLFERVYRNPIAKGEESKAKEMLHRLYEYYYAHPEALPEDFQPQLSFDGMGRTVCDYIAGMTDHYAITVYSNIYIPKAWKI
jgi:dGTPase